MKLGVMHAKVLAGFLAGAGLALVGSYYAEHRRAGMEPVPATVPAAPKALTILPLVEPPVARPRAQRPAVKTAVGEAAPKLPPFTEPALAAPPEQPKRAEGAVSTPVTPETAPEKPVDAGIPVTPAETTPAEPDPEPRAPHRVTIPDGTVLRVRMGEALSSKRNRIGDTFPGTLDQELVADGFVIAERGAKVEGRVTQSEEAGRTRGLAHLDLELTTIHTSDGQTVAIRTAKFEQLGTNSRSGDWTKVGIGAAAGAGTAAATRGKPAEIAVETRVSFRLQQPLMLTEKLP